MLKVYRNSVFWSFGILILLSFRVKEVCLLTDKVFMDSSFRYFLYRAFIDPLLSGIHRDIVNSAVTTGRIFQVFCMGIGMACRCRSLQKFRKIYE